MKPFINSFINSFIDSFINSFVISFINCLVYARNLFVNIKSLLSRMLWLLWIYVESHFNDNFVVFPFPLILMNPFVPFVLFIVSCDNKILFQYPNKKRLQKQLSSIYLPLFYIFLAMNAFVIWFITEKISEASSVQIFSLYSGFSLKQSSLKF